MRRPGALSAGLGGLEERCSAGPKDGAAKEAVDDGGST